MRAPVHPLRRLTALAALALAWTGVVELHGGDAGHLGAADAGAEVYACDAGHGPALHVEAARAVEPHDCAACLHRLHVRGGTPAAAALAAPAIAGDALFAPRTGDAPVPPLSRAPSRGPPLLA
ncbi:MAG TPA: hypothetical protein VHM02_14055 [Thermoanaerobaculia bacterium]|nr:hypothetical protein [Thermoanaerobaculia bacterium]